MRRAMTLVMATAMVLTSACVLSAKVPPGSEGGLCADDDDCDDGLICVVDECVLEDDDDGVISDRQLEVCVRSATCLEERDPAQFCRDAFEDCQLDEQCADVQRRCADINSVFIDCLLEFGTCDTIDGAEGLFFAVEATGPGGACEDLAQRSSACASES